MPGAYRISVYNKDGSEELLASTFGDFGIIVQSDRLLWNGADYPDSYVIFSNTSVIGYATTPNATVAEYPIGTEYTPSFGSELTLYEVERDPYNITFSKKQLIVKCKDKTMEKDLQISFGGSSGSTLKGLLDTTQSCQYLFSGYNGSTIPDGIIEYSDTSNVTRMNQMFYRCSNLTTIPQLDTSKVTNMNNMFGYCSNLTSIPQLNTSNATEIQYMFSNCSSLTTIPLLDTSNATNMSGTFNNCSNLTTIPQLDVSNVTSFSDVFRSCSKLKYIQMYGMKTSFDISASTEFEREDLVTILNNLATVTSTKTLTM